MISLPQCFSALAASGDGDKCNLLKRRLEITFSGYDIEAGCTKAVLFKYGMQQFPDAHKRLRKELGQIITSLTEDIKAKYFGSDLEGY
jgi:hypothetical protein